MAVPMLVTVTATVVDGFGWGQLRLPGRGSMRPRATMTVTLERVVRRGQAGGADR